MNIPARIDRDAGEGLSVVLFGAGGHARAVAHVLADLGARVAVLVDPQVEQVDGVRDNVLFLPDDDAGAACARDRSWPAVLGIGANHVRGHLAVRLLRAGLRLPPVIAHTATLAFDATVGAATVVMHHANVGSRARVGRAAIVNTGADVEHDCLVGDAAHIAPHAVLGGGARCGAHTLIGTNATLIPQVAIGDRAVVGAGAVVTKGLPDDVTIVGVPARIVDTRRRATPDA